MRFGWSYWSSCCHFLFWRKPHQPTIAGLPSGHEMWPAGKSTNNLMIFPAVNILPSGKRLHNYEKSPFLIGKSAISMGHVQSFLYVYQIKAVKPSSFRDPTIDCWSTPARWVALKSHRSSGSLRLTKNVMVWKFPKMELLLCLPGKSSK